MPSLVSCEITDNIADVRLNRPEKLNALTLPLLHELVEVAGRLREDKTLRAVILSGKGESFCAGLDFASVGKDRAGMMKAFVPRPWKGTNVFQEACWAWRRVPVPVIAAVEGHCFGGGIQIALAADFRITAPSAQWAVLEGKWGLIPDMSGVQALSELVGIETAKRLTMTAAIISGTNAVELGLAGQLADQPRDAAAELAASLATRSPDALAAAKRLFNGQWHASARRTFARERLEQLRLMRGQNAAIARTAGLKREAPVFGPRA